MLDYRLDVGDVLELSSVTLPEMRGRTAVQIDGSLSLPLVGRIEAAGRTLSEAQIAIRAALSAKVLRQRGADGRENVFLIQPDDIVVSVAEFRPVYVTGDVSRPGEQTFRPSMTVRQAIAVSGGPDVARYRATHPTLEAADLAGEYEALWIDVARRQSALWRLRRELGGEDALDEGALLALPLDANLVRRLIRAEREQLEVRDRDHRLERDHLQTTVRQAEQQMTILSDQREKEEQGREADAEELKRVQEMFGKGSLTSQRVTDARRAVLLSSTRKLQTDSQIAQLQKQQADSASALDRLEGRRRMRVGQEIADGDAGLAATRARIEAISEKLSYVALLRVNLQRGGGGGLEITILRQGERIAGSENFSLLPGDVVEVALKTPPSPGARAPRS